MADKPIIYRDVETERGPVVVRISRRGCSGEWTEADNVAMDALVRAALQQFGPAPSPTERDER